MLDTGLLDTGFVVGVLAGFEDTLDEVIGRVASPELNADLAVLQRPVVDAKVISMARLGGLHHRYSWSQAA